jgi:hypothetical protein
VTPRKTRRRSVPTTTAAIATPATSTAVIATPATTVAIVTPDIAASTTIASVTTTRASSDVPSTTKRISPKKGPPKVEKKRSLIAGLQDALLRQARGYDRGNVESENETTHTAQGERTKISPPPIAPRQNKKKSSQAKQGQP